MPFCLLRCVQSFGGVWLGDPVDCSPPSSSVRGISQAKNTGVGCPFLLQRIFLTPGLSPCLLRLLKWQADYLPLHDLGSSAFYFSCFLRGIERVFSFISQLNEAYVGAVTPHITSLRTWCGQGWWLYHQRLSSPAQGSHMVGAHPVPDGLDGSVSHQVIIRRSLLGVHPTTETAKSACHCLLHFPREIFFSLSRYSACHFPRQQTAPRAQ